MIEYPALMPYTARYADLVSVPLRIILTLIKGSPLAGYDRVHCDNLLARAVVDEATLGQGLPNASETYCLPIPLCILWRSSDDLPVPACSVLLPLTETVEDVAYWHKRVQSGRWTGTKTGNLSIRSSQGRYMERRVPLPTHLCRQWYADAIGDPSEVARLLAGIRFVGKRRSNGFGEVESWEVVPLDEFRLVAPLPVTDRATGEMTVQDCLTRPLPAAAVELLGEWRPDAEPAPCGWTMPQWMPRLFRLGWWAETPCHRVAAGADYFAAARLV